MKSSLPEMSTEHEQHNQPQQLVSWGWLEPSSVLLPHVTLRGLGVAIGRGKEAFEEHLRRRDNNTSTTPSLTNNSFNGRTREDALYKDLDFIEVADGRVSRMHCVIVQQMDSNELKTFVEDCSSNGTFLNGEKIKKGLSVRLKDKDKISLVRSVAPMTEQYFIFHKGSPQQKDRSKFNSTIEELENKEKSSRTLSRSLTSTYTTAERSTLADFECQICLRVLSSCVTIEPCGHNFCASCLSLYISSRMETGAQLLCPLRCPDPERIIKNETVRSLIAAKRKESILEKLSANDEEFQTIVEAEVSSFTTICPLFDEQLPLEIKSLKDRQIQLAVSRLSGTTHDVTEKNECLESLARLCWSDDTARKVVLDSSGILTIKETMETYHEHDSIQYNSCLALTSLVRGESEICRTSQWEIARSGIVQVIGRAMRSFEKHNMVQLSAMLCFIPLAHESPVMQAHLSEEILTEILHALDVHLQDYDVQCKGMIVLGLLARGDDALHDAIRIRQVDLGVIKRIKNALTKYGGDNEEVLWGALFALATIAKDKCPRFMQICRALFQGGMLSLLMHVLTSYEQKMLILDEEPDETIVSTSKYLISVIGDAENAFNREWQYRLVGSISIGLLIGSIFLFAIVKKRAHMF